MRKLFLIIFKLKVVKIIIVEFVLNNYTSN